MGVNDYSRFVKFAEFIQAHWPSSSQIADCAGGHGDLAFRLWQLGYSATVVDPRDTGPSGRVYRLLKNERKRIGRSIEIPRIIGRVEQTDLSDFDVLVGLHPDEATEWIVKTAIDHGKDFALVPCCVFPLDGEKRSKAAWFDYLRQLDPETRVAELPCRGDNTVFYRRSSTPTIQDG